MKMAILGAGNIARKMATTICGLDEVELYAVGARDLERAQAFADEFSATKAYGSYEELVADDNIDLIYVATLNYLHYEHVKLCLDNNRNVLCEKPFMMNTKQAKSILELAKSKNLFIAEAIWTRYLPMRETINEVLDSGIIGEISTITANLGYTRHYSQRLLDPAIGGGAVLDLGVYVINFASMILGTKVKNIMATACLTEKGVDCRNAIVLTYEDGKMATLTTTFLATTDRTGVIHGKEGFIKLSNINNYESLEVYNKEYELVKRIEAPAQITGFEYQVLAAKKAIEQGKTECEEMPHEEILRIMEVMDEVRAQCGVVFPCD
ncbi:MAG: Gfo/Idh/MocA family oxidoreductase [Clostridia bacterium]